MQMPDKLAVTYSWNRMAYIINKSLSKKGVQVFSGDTSWLNMNRFSILGNKCFQYPSVYTDSGRFLDGLVSYLRENEISYLMPVHEEIFIISKFQEQLGGITTLVPSFEQLRTAHKKDLSSALAKSLGIPVPLTYKPRSAEDCRVFFDSERKPVVLKYESSNGSKGVFYISELSELVRHYPFVGRFILQEFVKDAAGYGVSMLYNRGQLRASFTHRRTEEKLVSGGTSTVREGVRNGLLEEYAKLLLDTLSWNGVGMVEFKYDEKEKKGWFIEINPRFWGSLALPYFSGIDFPYLYFQILKNGDVEPCFKYREGVKVKWLLGGVLGFLDGLINHKKLLFHHLSLSADHFDDFSVEDPFVFVGEVAYYLETFLRSRKLNPTENSSLDIDRI